MAGIEAHRGGAQRALFAVSWLPPSLSSISPPERLHRFLPRGQVFPVRAVGRDECRQLQERVFIIRIQCFPRLHRLFIPSIPPRATSSGVTPLHLLIDGLRTGPASCVEAKKNCIPLLEGQQGELVTALFRAICFASLSLLRNTGYHKAMREKLQAFFGVIRI